MAVFDRPHFVGREAEALQRLVEREPLRRVHECILRRTRFGKRTRRSESRNSSIIAQCAVATDPRAVNGLKTELHTLVLPRLAQTRADVGVELQLPRLVTPKSIMLLSTRVSVIR